MVSRVWVVARVMARFFCHGSPTVSPKGLVEVYHISIVAGGWVSRRCLLGMSPFPRKGPSMKEGLRVQRRMLWSYEFFRPRASFLSRILSGALLSSRISPREFFQSWPFPRPIAQCKVLCRRPLRKSLPASCSARADIRPEGRTSAAFPSRPRTC